MMPIRELRFVGASALIVLGSSLHPTHDVAAQTSASTRQLVRGTVFDSIAGSPLVGAVVQMASADTRVVPLSDTTDTAGQFQFDGLQPGRYVVDFEHDRKRALGLATPLREVLVTAGATELIVLAIPSASTVHRLRCPADVAGSESIMLAGLIRRADRAAVATGTSVTARWKAIVLAGGKIRTDTQQVTSAVDSDGTYTLCGVPVDASVGVTVRGNDTHTIVSTLDPHANEVTLQDYLLSDSTQMHGHASLYGIAIDESGKRIPSGHATIPALGIDVPIANGAFVLGDLPSGTWTLELRAIGYPPHAAQFTIEEKERLTREFAIPRKVQALDVVKVVGTTGREAAIIKDVIKRHQSSFGTIFLPGDPALEAAMFPSDVLRSARGFSYRSQDNISAAKCPSEEAAPDIRKRKHGNVVPPAIAVYVNGERIFTGFEGLNRMIRARDILAVEAYPWSGNAPVEMRPNDACAVVVVWTR